MVSRAFKSPGSTRPRVAGQLERLAQFPFPDDRQSPIQAAVPETGIGVPGRQFQIRLDGQERFPERKFFFPGQTQVTQPDLAAFPLDQEFSLSKQPVVKLVFRKPAAAVIGKAEGAVVALQRLIQDPGD